MEISVTTFLLPLYWLSLWLRWLECRVRTCAVRHRFEYRATQYFLLSTVKLLLYEFHICLLVLRTPLANVNMNRHERAVSNLFSEKIKNKYHVVFWPEEYEVMKRLVLFKRVLGIRIGGYFTFPGQRIAKIAIEPVSLFCRRK